jgi:hypothetical protein
MRASQLNKYQKDAKIKPKVAETGPHPTKNIKLLIYRTSLNYVVMWKSFPGNSVNLIEAMEVVSTKNRI